VRASVVHPSLSLSVSLSLSLLTRTCPAVVMGLSTASRMPARAATLPGRAWRAERKSVGCGAPPPPSVVLRPPAATDRFNDCIVAVLRCFLLGGGLDSGLGDEREREERGGLVLWFREPSTLPRDEREPLVSIDGGTAMQKRCGE
jgi:hypothetical protein